MKTRCEDIKTLLYKAYFKGNQESAKLGNVMFILTEELKGFLKIENINIVKSENNNNYHESNTPL